MDESDRRYSDEEVSAIIRRALGQGSHRETIDQGELEDIARSSGISPEALRDAIQAEGSEGELEAAKEQWIKRHRREFFNHLTAYCIINGFLFMVNIVTTPRTLWVIWPLMGWGIGLAFHFMATFNVSDDEVERGARRLLSKKHGRMKWENERA